MITEAIEGKKVSITVLQHNPSMNPADSSLCPSLARMDVPMAEQCISYTTLSNSFSNLTHTMSRRVAGVGVGVGADTSFILPIRQTRNLNNLSRVTQLVNANIWAPT